MKRRWYRKKKQEEKKEKKEGEKKIMVEENNGKVSNTKKPEGLWPGERMFAADERYWLIAFSIWFLGLVLISVLLGKISLLVIGSYIVAFLVWLLLFCSKTLLENQRAKPVMLGIIGKKISWGTVLILWPVEKLIMFPTGIQQIILTGRTEDKGAAGIQTKAGVEEGTGRSLPSIVLPVEPVLNYRYPSDDDSLTETIKNAPHPDDQEALIDIIQEPILDIIRNTGGKLTYLEIAQKRMEFAEQVTTEMQISDSISNLVNLARLRDFTISFKHMTLPEELKKQQIEEAAASHKGEAERIMLVKKGEGSKEILRLEGEGKAYAEGLVRTKILDVLTDPKYANVAMQLEGLKAFTDASQGGKGTIIFPTELLSALGGVLGKPSSNVLADIEKLGISQEKLAQLIASALEQEKT